MKVIQFQDRYWCGWAYGDMVFTTDLSEAIRLKNKLEELARLSEMERRGYRGIVVDMPEVEFVAG